MGLVTVDTATLGMDGHTNAVVLGWSKGLAHEPQFWKERAHYNEWERRRQNEDTDWPSANKSFVVVSFLVRQSDPCTDD